MLLYAGLSIVLQGFLLIRLTAVIICIAHPPLKTPGENFAEVKKFCTQPVLDNLIYFLGFADA